MSTTTTKEQVAAALNLVLAVSEVIRTAGSIPSGELYAILMPKLDIEAYQQLLRTLTGAGLIRESNHLITWIGPMKGVE